jgi:uncharacterized repeat protein (TIGR01451 family)
MRTEDELNRKRVLLTLGMGILVLSLSGICSVTAFADASRARSFAESHILYILIPPDVSKEAFLHPGDALKRRLYRLIAEGLALQNNSAYTGDDMVVIFLDHEGEPILPDLEEARLFRPHPGSTPSSPPHNLTFTFRSPDCPWEGKERAVLHKAATAFYRVIKEVYGDPAFAITVNVRKDPTIPFWGVYSPSTNEILLSSASHLDVFCHEIIHAFRDDDMIRVSSYEEGMTVAAEVEVFNRLPAYTFWDEHHEYPDDVFYEGLNNEVISPFQGRFDYASPLLLLRYQLAGYAWGKVLLENPDFFSAFNRELYSGALSDPYLLETPPGLFDIAAAQLSTVEGKPFAVWYGQQAILGPAPPAGSFLYQNISNFVVYLFYRDDSGNEQVLPDTMINWAVYDYRDKPLDHGSALTSDLGWISFAPDVPADYRGRIKMAASATTVDGEIISEALRSFGEEEGVFGVLPEDDSGVIDIVPLDQPTSAVRIDVVNGAFSVPLLTSVKGRFVSIFRGKEGRSFSRQFNKDAGSYFLLMTEGETAADLALSQSVESVPEAAMQDLVFTVTITNTGPGLSTDLVLTDTLDGGGSFVFAASSQGSCVGHSGILTCALNSLAAGSTATVIIEVSPFSEGSITNSAEITANGYDPDITNNTATASFTVKTITPRVPAAHR